MKQFRKGKIPPTTKQGAIDIVKSALKTIIQPKTDVSQSLPITSAVGIFWEENKENKKFFTFDQTEGKKLIHVFRDNKEFTLPTLGEKKTDNTQGAITVPLKPEDIIVYRQDDTNLSSNEINSILEIYEEDNPKPEEDIKKIKKTIKKILNPNGDKEYNAFMIIKPNPSNEYPKQPETNNINIPDPQPPKETPTTTPNNHHEETNTASIKEANSEINPLNKLLDQEVATTIKEEETLERIQAYPGIYPGYLTSINESRKSRRQPLYVPQAEHEDLRMNQLACLVNAEIDKTIGEIVTLTRIDRLLPHADYIAHQEYSNYLGNLPELQKSRRQPIYELKNQLSKQSSDPKENLLNAQEQASRKQPPTMQPNEDEPNNYHKATNHEIHLTTITEEE